MGVAAFYSKDTVDGGVMLLQLLLFLLHLAHDENSEYVRIDRDLDNSVSHQAFPSRPGNSLVIPRSLAVPPPRISNPLPTFCVSLASSPPTSLALSPKDQRPSASLARILTRSVGALHPVLHAFRAHVLGRTSRHRR
jgi:hypothetical protein